MRPLRASALPFEVRHARAVALMKAHRRPKFTRRACSCDLCLCAFPVLIEAKAREAIPVWCDVARSQRVAAIEQGMRDSQSILGYTDEQIARAIALLYAVAAPSRRPRPRRIPLTIFDPRTPA